MMTREAVIIAGARLPVAKGGPGGALCSTPPEVFGGHLLRQLVERASIDPGRIDDVILGNVMGAYLCFARLCLLTAGLPPEIPGVSLDRNCASGMQAIAFAAQAIKAGEADLIIAGGAESMTRQPWFLEKPASGFSRAPLEVRSLSRITAPPAFGGYTMGETAENVAERYGISRADQDDLAAESHLRALAAWEKGRFNEEVIPITVRDARGKEIVFARDETMRPPDRERMAALPTIFKKGGTVTAATSSPISDGAAALVLMSGDMARQEGFTPRARVVSSAVAGVDPAYMGLGPIPAVNKVLARSGLKLADMGLVEINEAFAAQTLACLQELGLSRQITNVNGSGISLGHPIGATGARISVSLLAEMGRRSVRYGLAAMCVGGGQGSAIIYELL